MSPISHVSRTGIAIGLALAVCLASGPASPARAQDPPVYSFGVVPQFEARALADIWLPILAELERRTGYRFDMRGSATIPVFEASFEAGEFDFAYMNPYHCLVAMETQGYAPLVRDGSRMLFGVLVVRKDSPYHAVTDLEGQAISFPAPNALGASLLMRAELTRKVGITFAAVYAQTHSSAYLNTVLGETAAAGGVMSTFDQQPPEIRDQLRIIYETQRTPPHPVVAHPRVPAVVRDEVTQALLDMAATPEGQAMLAKIPMVQAVPADASEYAALRELGLRDFYVK